MIIRRLRRERSRALLIGGALCCFAGAFALTPTDVRSQLAPPPPAVLSRASPQPVAAATAIVAASDPFAPRAALDDERPSPIPLPPVPLALRPLPGHDASTVTSDRVTAIVMGPQPTAVVEHGIRTDVVGVGDRVGSATVSAIASDAVILSDGRRLALNAADEAKP
jgi:hypothetical protein